jgi:hypothetical protein
MLSAGTRGVTIVTIFTLIFATILRSDGSQDVRFAGATVKTYIERCLPSAPCPFHRVEVRTIFQPPVFTLPPR